MCKKHGKCKFRFAFQLGKSLTVRIIRGYTGKNVVVTILDDGIQPNHPELAKNYVSLSDCCLPFDYRYLDLFLFLLASSVDMCRILLLATISTTMILIRLRKIMAITSMNAACPIKIDLLVLLRHGTRCAGEVAAEAYNGTFMGSCPFACLT